MKGASPRYWNIYRVNPTRTHNGYECSVVPAAQAFLQQSISESEDIQSALLSHFYVNSKTDITSRAYAGLCLRCFVSEPILKACKKIHNLFASDKSFTYQELLGFVLNDDGKSLVITDNDRKTQLVVNSEGRADVAKYQFFTVKVLQTFKSDLRARMSLENWAYLQTKQNPEVKDFLSEFGFKHLSDWALLNRVRPKQLERLSKQDASLVEVFHCCYRRDRIQQQQHRKTSARCPDPSPSQLQEMLTLLQKRGANSIINNTNTLLKALRDVASQLRQYDIWSYRESLEVQDPETGSYVVRTDLPHNSISEVDVEQKEILEFLHSQLEITLINSIEQELESSISRLQKSKKYAPFAAKFIPGLQLYYQEGKSLKEITNILQMSSWDQARRVFNPGELLAQVRLKTVEKLLDAILKKACELGLTNLPAAPDYLKTLAEQIELFADEEIFQVAAEEIRAGKNRVMNSRYANLLCQNLQMASAIYTAS